MSSNNSRRPNVVMIVSDDQGAWALGCQGASDLSTPALDGLARDGALFPQSFCASPVCSPARASLLTGRMPSAHGVHDWIRGESYGIVEDHEIDYLHPFATTPRILADHGWRGGYSGKWHLGTGRQPASGFTYWYAHRSGDGPYRGAPVWRCGDRVQESRYITDAITEEAMSFLDQTLADDAPFYLAVNYTAPHSPWVDQHPAEWLAMYEETSFQSCPQPEPHPWFSWEPGPVSEAMKDPRPSLQGYFASISAMDAGIGSILRRLDQHGLRESTVVVFTSDNGFSCGHHGIWGKGNATWPLNLWEESVRVPLIISQPGRIRPGVMQDLVSACDLHPTVLELCGVPVPDSPLLAGRSIASQLTGQAPAGAQVETVMAFDEYGGTRMVRSRDWKYIARRDGPHELYHLTEDPAERHNRADDPASAAIQDDLHGVLYD
ncbi:MAG: sulfatase-like hydrolase/transferase, partial [Actinomycetota bacterium]|nr:sulfatase-like hydrolase/transferase [Actinomycetota bacterium]